MFTRVVWTMLLVTVGCCQAASAYERVPRLAFSSQRLPLAANVEFMLGSDNDILVYASDYLFNEFTKRAFTVYTKEETDVKQAQNEKTISELQDKVRLLQENLEEMANANDALTKRLEEIEKRLKQGQ